MTREVIHTCDTRGRSNCALCMQFEVELWNAIHRYAITVGGDPAHHIYGNTARMQAVADVDKIVARVASREQVDDLMVEDLVKGSNAAAAAACDRGAEINRLRAVLTEVRGFLRGVARRPELGRDAKDLLDEAERLDRVLAETKMKEPEIKAVKDLAQSGYAHAHVAIRPWTVRVDGKRLVDKAGRPRRFATERAAIAAARRGS